MKYYIHRKNNETNSYDIGSDLQIRNYSYIDSIQTNPNIIDNSKYIKLVNSLNEKQYTFFLYIMQQCLQKQKPNINLSSWWSRNRQIPCFKSFISRFI